MMVLELFYEYLYQNETLFIINLNIFDLFKKVVAEQPYLDLLELL